MRVALVYDRVNKWGGAESVLLAMHEIWPNAPLYTSVYAPELASWAKAFDVRTSFIQNTLLPKNRHEMYPFMMGLAFETFCFDEYDLVISITHEFAKAIITKPQTFHLCYCLTPVGYLWSGRDQYFSSKSGIFRSLSGPIISYLRWYDKIISHRPDTYIAISKTVQERIQKYYRQKSDVVYPPVSIGESIPNTGSNSGYYLIVSRLVPNKRVDVAIFAFNTLGLPLKIVGVGVEEKRLKKLARGNIEFLGHLTAEELQRYYRECLCLVVPAEEDFGIVSVEAQSFGKPVIALGKGGATETVIAGKTGWFFEPLSSASLIKAVRQARIGSISSKDCIENAKRFSKERFKLEFKKIAEQKLASYRKEYVL